MEQFASRPPAHRLVRLIEEYSRPEATRVLDLGCAGGRNAVLLAERGFAEVDLTGESVRPVAGEPCVYEGMVDGRRVLLEAEALDA